MYNARINNTQTGSYSRVVAVKEQHTPGPRAKTTTYQIRDIEIMCAISHPCLVPLLGWRETAFDIQMVMPLYDTDLHNYINNTTVCEGKAKVLAGCLIEGLSHLHGLHIMHRDLKPSNVLVQREPMAALISDFGAARPRLHLHINGAKRCTRCDFCQPMAANGILSEARCTRYYAAPEVLLSRAPSRVFLRLIK